MPTSSRPSRWDGEGGCGWRGGSGADMGRPSGSDIHLTLTQAVLLGNDLLLLRPLSLYPFISRIQAILLGNDAVDRASKPASGGLFASSAPPPGPPLDPLGAPLSGGEMPLVQACGIHVIRYEGGVGLDRGVVGMTPLLSLACFCINSHSTLVPAGPSLECSVSLARSECWQRWWRCLRRSGSPLGAHSCPHPPPSSPWKV